MNECPLDTDAECDGCDYRDMCFNCSLGIKNKRKEPICNNCINKEAEHAEDILRKGNKRLHFTDGILPQESPDG